MKKAIYTLLFLLLFCYKSYSQDYIQGPSWSCLGGAQDYVAEVYFDPQYEYGWCIKPPGENEYTPSGSFREELTVTFHKTGRYRIAVLRTHYTDIDRGAGTGCGYEPVTSIEVNVTAPPPNLLQFIDITEGSIPMDENGKGIIEFKNARVDQGVNDWKVIDENGVEKTAGVWNGSVVFEETELGLHEYEVYVTYNNCIFNYAGSVVREFVRPCPQVSMSVSGDDAEYSSGGYVISPNTTYTLNTLGDDGNFDINRLSHNAGDALVFNGRQFSVSEEFASINVTYQNDCGNSANLKLFLGGRDVVIEQNCPVTIPDILSDYGYDPSEDDGTVLEHFAANISSRKSIVVKPGLTLTSGAELNLEAGTPKPVNDRDKNFIESTAYDDYGRIILQGRQYYDEQGVATQSQTKNLEDGVILTSEVVRDTYGRIALQTLPAPTKAASYESQDPGCDNIDLTQDPSLLAFEYKNDFINGEGNEAYDHTKFDGDNEYNPAAVENNVAGSLGWYYSTNNGNATGDQAVFNEPMVATTGNPYSRTLYYHDGSGAVKTMAGPGDEFKAGSDHLGYSDVAKITAEDHVYLDEYFNIRLNELGYPKPLNYDENFAKSISVDGMDRKSWVYADKSGKVIISLYFGDAQSSVPTIRSYQFYDEQDRLSISLTPNGWQQYKNNVSWENVDKTEYFYNYQGWLLATEETDAGRSEFAYRKDGQIRFSQDAEQAKNSRFSYTNYDHLGRPIESGEWVTGIDNFDMRTMLKPYMEELGSTWMDILTGSRQDWVMTTYDVADTDIASATGITGKTQKFVRGAVSYSENGNSKTWYSYDERGRVTWVIQQYVGLGSKVVEYTYGPTGAVELIAYQADKADAFYHFYTYDKNGMLSQVYTATDRPVYNAYGEIENPQVLKQQAIYDYYLHGPLKRIELADQLQGIDFVYTIGGALKGINSGNPENDPGQDGITTDGSDNGFMPDVFGMNLHYYDGDYNSAELGTIGISNTGAEPQYTGNIRASNWFSPVDGGQMKSYAYAYDNRSQLSHAQWASVSSAGNSFLSIPAMGAFEVSVPSYDLNGNIQSLDRNNELGNSIANFTYNYKLNSNQLTSVTEGEQAYRTYGYNDIGQMIRQTEGEESMYNQYDVTGKVVGVYAQKENDVFSQPIVTFTYDNMGFRSSKVSYDEEGNITKKQWYVRDASGTLLSIYDENVNTALVEQAELPIYGSGRIGLYKPNQYYNKYLYELQDHLGNVRAVIGDPVTLEYLATFESERKEKEVRYIPNINTINYEGSFENYNSITTADYINHTSEMVVIDDQSYPVENPNEVVRINNGAADLESPSNPIGAGIFLAVSPGDVLKMEVYAKYADFDSDMVDVVPLLAGQLSAFFNTPDIVDADGVARNIFADRDAPSILDLPTWDDVDDSQPRAFLNYMLFDKNFTYQGFEVKQVSAAAEISETDPFNQSHEKLELEVTVQKPGFIYVYVSNEDQQNMDVYFDDLKVTHEMGNIVAGSDFYPFGLTMEERNITREAFRYGYQGKFAEEDEETGWNSFELRMYDPVIGRWMSTDPYSQYASPYLGMGNNPIFYTDPNGGCTDGNGKEIPCPDGVEDGIDGFHTTILDGVDIQNSRPINYGPNYDLMWVRDGLVSLEYYGPTTDLQILLDVPNSKKRVTSDWKIDVAGTIITVGMTSALFGEIGSLMKLGEVGVRALNTLGGGLGATSQQVKYRVSYDTKQKVAWYGVKVHNYMLGTEKYSNLGTSTSDPITYIDGKVTVEYMIIQNFPDGSSVNRIFSESFDTYGKK